MSLFGGVCSAFFRVSRLFLAPYTSRGENFAKKGRGEKLKTMDVLLDVSNTWLSETWPSCPLGEDNPVRVFSVLWTILMVGSGLSYFSFAGM